MPEMRSGANPSPGEKVARPSEARKSGSEVECGRQSNLRYIFRPADVYVFLRLFLRTESDVSTRIPLPPPSGAPSPRERGYWEVPVKGSKQNKFPLDFFIAG